MQYLKKSGHLILWPFVLSHPKLGSGDRNIQSLFPGFLYNQRTKNFLKGDLLYKNSIGLKSFENIDNLFNLLLYSPSSFLGNNFSEIALGSPFKYGYGPIIRALFLRYGGVNSHTAHQFFSFALNSLNKFGFYWLFF